MSKPDMGALFLALHRDATDDLLRVSKMPPLQIDSPTDFGIKPASAKLEAYSISARYESVLGVCGFCGLTARLVDTPCVDQDGARSTQLACRECRKKAGL